MEQQPMDQNQSLFQIHFDPASSSALQQSASWARIMGIGGFIFGGLTIILGFLVRSLLLRQRSGGINGEQAYNADLAANIGMFFYVIVGVIIIVSSAFAFNFGARTSKAIKINDEYSLAAGFRASRNFFALWAIIIILCSLIALLGVFGISVTAAFTK